MAENGDSDRVAETDREPALDTTDPMTAEQPSGVDSTGQGEQDATHCPRRHGRSSAGSPPAPDDRVAEIRQRLEAATPGMLIRWESGRYGVLYGYIGSLRTSVFSINRSVTRDPLPSRLRSGLPGFTAERSSATEDESKTRAEAVLIAFFLRALSGTTEGPS